MDSFATAIRDIAVIRVRKYNNAAHLLSSISQLIYHPVRYG